MKLPCFTLLLAGSLAAIPASAAPRSIVLSDSLLAGADPLKVKMGIQWRGIHRWRIGDYAVVSSKLGWTITSTQSNLFKTKTASHSGNTFAFVLSRQAPDSAFVTAAHDLSSQANPGLNVGGGWSLGGDRLVHEAESFIASIVINRDTSDTWTLSMTGSSASYREGGDPVWESTHSPILTHGDRKVGLALTFSTKSGPDPRPASFFSRLKSQVVPPSMGYEFSEEGRGLCAVQFFSQGLGGASEQSAWMRRDIDEHLKLVLAAAMTAVLEMECSASPPALPEQE